MNLIPLNSLGFREEIFLLAINILCQRNIEVVSYGAIVTDNFVIDYESNM